MRKFVEGIATCIQEIKPKDGRKVITIEQGKEYRFFGIQLNDKGIADGVIYIDIPELHISVRFNEIIFI